jgi:hypothetical protein
MKPRFNIGDYVEVRAVTLVAYGSTVEHPALTRQLQREMLSTPTRGWIVGAVRRFEGSIGPAEYDSDEGLTGRPFLTTTGSKLLWRIAQSLMNVPIEAADADVDLLALAGSSVSPAKAEHVPTCPLRCGTPWSSLGLGGWSPADQRKEMSKRARDAKGRWLRLGVTS